MIIRLRKILWRCMLQTMRKVERKPLSFSTTMRNPDRIAGFIECLLPFENKLLTSEVIRQIICLVLNKKLYSTIYQNRNAEYKRIYLSEDENYTKEQLLDIIENSPQQHKEAGFEQGWDSRFDTWFKLPMEFGFVFYAMQQPIRISNTGHMLIDAYRENPSNERKIQNVFLNAMMKYQSDNPFRRNKNSNVPLLLLLNVLKLLKADTSQNGSGVSRQELSLFICWNNSNANELYKKIIEIRNQVGFSGSDEYFYAICMDLLGADETKQNRFKMSQICGELVDEYIRKMRSTGIISFRGNGRFIDLNTLEINKIDYVIQNYSAYKSFSDCREFYEYMGTIDSSILEIDNIVKIDTTDIRKKALKKYSVLYSEDKVFDELRLLSARKPSKDEMLKFINAPTRLEFLTSIALIQHFKSLDVNPNYSVDDEGLPTFTAGGDNADIVCCDNDYDSLFEVTLMCGRQDQVNNEIIPIRRHLLEHKKERECTFSVFVAPKVHADTREAAEWYKHKDNVDIVTCDIEDFILKLGKINKASQLLIENVK